MKSVYAVAAFIALATALAPDVSGAKNVGNGKGTQFITGGCTSNADCESTCCATLGSLGICSGVDAATQQGKTGCGFGGGAAAASSSTGAAGANAAVVAAPAVSSAAAAGGAPANGGPAFDPSGVKNVGNAKAAQFIGGQCLSTADCASGCCAGPSGICSGPGASTQNGKTGCGFTSTKKLLRV